VSVCVRRDNSNANDYEKKQRDLLTDRIVKRNIYIQSKGTIKFKDMTSEMIREKRQSIIVYRNREIKPKRFPSCRVYFITCSVCGKMFTSHRKRARCSRECDLEYGRSCYYTSADQTCAMMRDRYEPKPKIELSCKQCGNTFMGNQGNSYCSKVCRQAAKQGRKTKRRAEKAGVFYEPVNPLKVFKRDGWRCQLCGKKLKPKHRGTYRDDAPELDHIIPWAQGGEHSYRNTQCSCRKCNAEKGAQIIGQLRLFG